MEANVKDHIIGLERRLWLDGPSAFETVMAPDCVMVFPEPVGILDRSDVLASLDRFARWDSVELDSPEWRQPAPNVALLSYQARAKRGESPYNALCSSAYILEGRAWLIVLHQHTISTKA